MHQRAGRRPCCARDAGVASRLSHAACAASGNRTSPRASRRRRRRRLHSPPPRTRRRPTARPPSARASAPRAPPGTRRRWGRAASRARARRCTRRRGRRDRPPDEAADEAADDKSASHKPRATAPSASRYREKWSISRHTSCMSLGLAKSLYMSDSGRSSRSSSAASRASRSASAPPRPRAPAERRVQPSLKLQNLDLTLERLHLGLGGSAFSELGARPRRLGVSKREVQQRRALVEGHGAVRGGDAFGEGEKHLRRESVPLPPGVQPREELQVPGLVTRERAALPRRLKGAALGEVLLEGTRGELQEVLVAAQRDELGVHPADEGAVARGGRPGNLRGGGGGDGSDYGDGAIGSPGVCRACGDAAAAAAAAAAALAAAAPAAAAAAAAAGGEDACAHLSSNAASPLARSSDGRAAHTAPRDPGGEPGSATPVASARIATQTYSKHSSGSVVVAPVAASEAAIRASADRIRARRAEPATPRAGRGPSRRGFPRRRPPPPVRRRRRRRRERQRGEAVKAPKVGELRHNRGGITRERNAEEHLQRRRRRLRARAKVPRVPRVPRALQQLARPENVLASPSKKSGAAACSLAARASTADTSARVRRAMSASTSLDATAAPSGVLTNARSVSPHSC